MQIREKLAGVSGLKLLSLPPEARKDAAAKQKLYAEVDVVILCLPDEAAKEAAHLIDAMGADAPRVIDASSAHRVAPGWTYGFPELVAGQGEAVAKARKVSNPGCHATGAIALLRPLVDAGLLPKDAGVSIGSVSGYSGGGKSMIEAYETGRAPAFELYGLQLEHKHMPEIQLYSGLTARPIFLPSVGNFRQGMLVSAPLHLDALPGKPKGADLSAVFTKHYRGETHFRVMESEEVTRDRAGIAERDQRHRDPRVRQRGAPPGAAHRQIRQSRQRRVGRGGAKPHADAGALRRERRLIGPSPVRRSGLAHTLEKSVQLGQMGRVVAHRRPGGAGARDGESRVERETGLD